MADTKEVEIGEEEVKQIADVVKESMKEEVKTSVETSVKESIESALADLKKQTEEETKKLLDQHLEKFDKADKKDLGDQGKGADDAVAKALADEKFDESVTKMTASMRFYRAMRALDNESMAELKELNAFAIASQLSAREKLMAEKGEQAVLKTGYANETTAADGAVLIPDAEFVTTVFDNLPSFGVAFRYADVRQTDRTAVRVLTLDSGLTFYSTAEAGVKTSAKLAFAKNEVSLQKYAVIVPATDELTDDAAIDYWNLVTRELSRAYAKKADELVFTDATYGITNQSGVLTEAIDGAQPDWDDLLDLQAKLEDDIDESGYVWFMRKETWYRLVQTRGTTNDHYLAGSLNTANGWAANINQPTTPWGTPVVFTRVLPTSNAVSDNDAFAVYGDLKNTLLYNKRGMAMKMLTEATVVDADGVDLNLATQDASAMRAVIRMLHILPKGNRAKFGVLGKGTVS